MSKNDYLIRLERKEDYPVVENLIRESFWNVYRPGCLEHYLITKLREHPDFVKELDFVMEKDGEIIGQNVFVKANTRADDGRNIPILTMGPICIAPELKRQGYGKILLDYSIEKATELGFGFDGCSLPPVKIAADSHEVLLVGKIDRVDVCGDKFVLVDYKTGSVSFSENELYAGKKLQLLTYVKACLQAMQKECAGFFYLPVNDAFQEENGKRFCYVGRVQNDAETIYQLDTKSRQTGESSLFGKKLTKEGVLSGNTTMGINQKQLQIYLDYTQKMLQNAIKDMADGFIAQHPYKSNCDYCDYATVCNYQERPI